MGRLTAPPGRFVSEVILLVFLAAIIASQPASGAAQAQVRPTAPATPTPARPATQAPAPAAPRRAAAAPARGGVTILVTDMSGAPLRNVSVQAVGPIERSGTTDTGGQLRITGLPAGTYRLRFSSDSSVDFEREVVVRGGPNSDIDVSLRPAPPPVVITAPAPTPAPPPPAEPGVPVGPIGQPQSVTIQSLPNSEFIRNEPRKETLLSCSGNTRTTLVQMNQDQAPRLYESADATYYVVAGEGTVTIGTQDIAVEATSFVSVPRGVRFEVSRKGRRPLIMVMQLSGEPCEQAK